MPISEEQYNRITKALLAAGDDPEAMSPEVRAKAEEAKAEYETSLAKSIDPSLPPMAQALSTQPATTHPDGDEAAAAEWLSNPQGANGTITVYETPLAKVRQDLLENPSRLGALGWTTTPPSPETIQEMDAEHPLYRAYNDDVWRKTADAAAKAGKRAYRYSKAPYLQGGSFMSTLDSLGMKLNAGLGVMGEGLGAFVMGYDDTAQFGAMRSAGETQDAQLQALNREHQQQHPEIQPDAPSADQVVGGVDRADRKLRNTELEQEYPALHTAGQVVGAVPGLVGGAVKGAGTAIGKAVGGIGRAVEGLGSGIAGLAPWSASNALFNEVASGGEKLLAKAGVTSAVAPVATGAIAGAVGGAGTQAAQEAFKAGANYQQTGDAGTTAGAAALRSLEAGLAPALIGGAGGLVREGAGAVGEWVRHGGKGSVSGGRYKGLPGKLERAGLAPELGRGFVAPEPIRAAQKEARQLEVPVEQVLAERVAPKVTEGARAATSGAKPKVKLHSDGSVTKSRAPSPAMDEIAADAYPAIKRFAGKSPDVRQTRALLEAAGRAGVEGELRQTRVPSMLSQLEQLISPGRKHNSPTLFGTVNNVGDELMMRAGYPAVRALERQGGALGRAGALGAVGKDEEPAERKSDEAARAARYAAWREEQQRRARAPKPRKKHRAQQGSSK